MAEVALRNVVKRTTTSSPSRSINLDIPNQEFVVLVGPSGCGKSDHAAHDRRPGGNHRRRNLDRRRGRQRPAAEGPRHRHGVPELRALSAHDGRRKHVVRAASCANSPRPRSSGASTTPPAFSTSPSCSTAGPSSSPAASASASPWAAPSCAIRRCSCSTSRCPTSTPSCACRCAPRSSACIRRSRPRRSMSPTTRSRR